MSAFVGTETDLIDRWLVAVLGADGSAVYADLADEGAPYPFYVFTMLSGGSDTLGVGQARIMARPLYLVKATVQSLTYDAARPAAKRADQLLHGARNVAVPGGLILSCTREAPFKLAENANGVSYRHLGGMYRFEVQAK